MSREIERLSKNDLYNIYYFNGESAKAAFKAANDAQIINGCDHIVNTRSMECNTVKEKMNLPKTPEVYRADGGSIIFWVGVCIVIYVYWDDIFGKPKPPKEYSISDGYNPKYESEYNDPGGD